MKTYFIPDFDIYENTGDVSDQLQSIFDSLEDGDVVQFKKGSYRVFKTIRINNKNHIKILGNFSTIIAHFDATAPIAENNNVFSFSDCEDVEFSGFFFETDAPIGAAGEIIAINRDEQTADLRVYDEFPITGLEHFCATNSFDEKGSPDYALTTYNFTNLKTEDYRLPDGRTVRRLVGLEYDVIGEQTVRLKLGNRLTDQLHIGHKINIRYEVYGNNVLEFASCHRFNINNVVIYAAASFGARIKPRSSDFTFDHFSIEVKPGSRGLMAANADGIHILGLYGQLTLKHCNMEFMGDDTLNIHSIAGAAMNIDREKRSMRLYRPFRGNVDPLPDLWAVPGDKICVYDSQTFLPKGSFVIDTIDQRNNATYKDLEGELNPEDTLANTQYYASLHIDACTVRNTRARGFLIQTHNVLIENSYICGMSLPALLFAPDIRVWWEVGPCRNVEIRNNVIESCAGIRNGANVGAIVFKACHDQGGTDYPAGVHKNIHIHHNRFRDLTGPAIYVSAAEDVRIEHNVFENCCSAPQFPFGDHEIAAVNCKNLTVSDNVSDRAAEILYTENCERREQ